MDASEGLVSDLCRDLRLLWTQAGGPTFRVLADHVRLGKSQVVAILNGDIRQPPDWDVVKGLVDSLRQHAQDNGRTLSLSTAVDEYWRPRYTMIEHAGGRTTRPVPRQLPPAAGHFAGRARQWEALSRLVPLARHQVVVACLRRALRIFRELGSRFHEAVVLGHLAWRQAGVFAVAGPIRERLVTSR